MADPFKKAIGRVMRTDLKSDEEGPYYDVNVSGGGGVAPVPFQAEGEGAPPTVLDPQRDFGPPLPPGSTDERSDDGPDEEPDDYEPDYDEDDSEDDAGFDPNGDATAVRAMYEARRALYQQHPDFERMDPNAAPNVAQAWIDNFARKRLEIVGLDPVTADPQDMAAALGVSPAIAASLRERLASQGGFGGEE